MLGICLACVVAIDACGGNDERKAAFAKRADEVCHQAQPTFRVGGELAEVLPRRAAALDALIRRLKALDPPGNVDGAMTEYLEGLAMVSKETRRAAAAERRGDRAAAGGAFLRIRVLIAGNEKTVRQIGFGVCSGEGDPKGGPG